jgi:hypothetical protein
VFAEIVVNPIGDFPLNDDWSYGKALYYSANKSFTIGHFGAMSLFTHLLWGGLFVKVFGFSFTVLRFSTIVSVLISLFFLEKIVFDTTKNKILSTLACCVLLFNPLYFNLSNTYMTDVNFNTLLILCCYSALHFFQTKKIIDLLLFTLFSVFLVLIRQFGIIVPVCFFVACLFLNEKKIQWLSVAFLSISVVYASLHFYELYLSTVLPEGSAYKFSGGVHITDREFWKIVQYNFGERYKIVLVNLGIYTAPIAAYFLLDLIKQFKIYVSLLVIFLSAIFVLYFFNSVKFPFSNIFQNLWLGPETFHQSLGSNSPHVYSKASSFIFTGVKYFFTWITLSTLILYVATLFKFGKIKRLRFFSPELIFLLGFLITYAFMIFITESFFDRYFIPQITVVIILIASMNKNQVGTHKPVMVLLLLFFYVSVLGTRDYLTWNRIRWEAYNDLQQNENLVADDVNAGFEVNCWNDRKETWWSDYLSVDHFNYLIQFKKENGFKVYKQYQFQRYLPYRKDTLNVFVREDKLAVPN